MPIPSLVLELWQFLFIRDSPEIWKSEKTLSEFCPISRDGPEWRILNLARTSLISCYRILQNARVTVFTVSEVLSGNQQGSKITTPLSCTQIKTLYLWHFVTKCCSYFITKCDRILLQNASGFLLQNATFITNCDSTDFLDTDIPN